MQEDGEEEIKILLDFSLTKVDAIALLQKMYPNDPEEVDIEILSYDYDKRWLEDGSVNPDYIKEQEKSYLSMYDGNLFDDIETFEESPTQDKRTPFEDYKALVQSKYITESWHFKLRECYLSQEQLKELNALSSHIQFLHIPTPSDYYLSHKFSE